MEGWFRAAAASAAPPLWIKLTCVLLLPGAICLSDSLLVPAFVGGDFITSFNEAHLFFEDMSR